MNKTHKTSSKVVDATRKLAFAITAASIKQARCKDPGNCVVALAVRNALGDMFDGIEVGSSIIKVYCPGRIIRYGTPKVLRDQIPEFDRTGKWSLPVGQYILMPPAPSMKLGGRPNRWQKKPKGENKGMTVFQGRKLATRRVKRVNEKLVIVAKMGIARYYPR